MTVRVLRVYHGGRDPQDRGRDRALAAAGVDVTLVVPHAWPGAGSESILSVESFRVAELGVEKAGDVNRHVYTDEYAVRRIVDEVEPDLVDCHEEPVSLVSRQWRLAVRRSLPIVMYTAQNIDKRYPPPFAQFERAALRRAAALYPCSAQAASVARGKGFCGLLTVLSLGYDDDLFYPGNQSAADDELVLAIVGRLVPEKGVSDAVRVLAAVHKNRATRLVVAGQGPEALRARSLATALGVGDRLELRPWQSATELADIYRSAHVLLVPSIATTTWAEQFGRVIVQAQASGAVVAGYASGSIHEVAGDAAILTDAGAVSHLGRAVVELMDDASDYARRRGRGIELSRHRTWAQVAKRQVELYRRVVAEEICPSPLPCSPCRRREAARAEFGPPSATPGGRRPFALPFIRRGGFSARCLGKVLDLTAEVAAGLADRALSSRRDRGMRA